MKIVICPDKFKGSMTAVEVASTISAAVLSVVPDAEVVMMPMADGGEGSMEVLTRGRGEYIKVQTVDPLMRPIEARYGLIGDTAIVEMSEAAGLMLLSKEERNPEKTSSYGFGVVIAEALRRGAKRLLLGIGGSATNDCGIGMLTALGFVFSDSMGMPVVPIGENLGKIEHIKPISFPIPVKVACDVTNYLYGRDGAAHIYAPQKGADEAMCQRLDQGLHHFSDVVKRELAIDLSQIKGGGAAGGVGAALSGFLSTEMINGTFFIASELGLYEQILTADLVITGEGRVDKSTLHDKLTYTIAKYARQHKIPVVVVCGVAKDVTNKELCVQEILQLKAESMTTEESMRRGKELLYECFVRYFSKS